MEYSQEKVSETSRKKLSVVMAKDQPQPHLTVNYGEWMASTTVWFHIEAKGLIVFYIHVSQQMIVSCELPPLLMSVCVCVCSSVKTSLVSQFPPSKNDPGRWQLWPISSLQSLQLEDWCPIQFQGIWEGHQQCPLIPSRSVSFLQSWSSTVPPFGWTVTSAHDLWTTRFICVFTS